MRPSRHLLVMLVGPATAALIATAPSAAQQDAPSPPAVPDTTCTYTECSLWLDAGALVRGAQASVVSRSGFFRILRVLPFVSGDSARHYAARYEHRERRSSRFQLVGTTLMLAGAIVALSADCDAIATPFGYSCQNESAGPIAGGLLVGGMTLNVVGMIMSLRGHRSLVRALWWHNSQFAR